MVKRRESEREERLENMRRLTIPPALGLLIAGRGTGRPPEPVTASVSPSATAPATPSETGP